MQQFTVKGMSCAACSARVEKAVSKLNGVTECNVNLLTNSMDVEGDVKPDEIIKAVENAGYKAFIKKADKNTGKTIKEKNSEESETKAIKQRLLVSLVFLLGLMYFSFGQMMISLPLPASFEGNPVAVGLMQMLLCIIIMIINKKFFISGFRSVWHLAPNMDALVALGSGASFVWSVFVIFKMSSLIINGDLEAANMLKSDLYFESAAMILTLITLGKMLESYSKGKTTSALKALTELKPKTATVIRNGKEVLLPASDIRVGDIFIVRAGDMIPADGIVTEGSGTVNESALTGESMPQDKTAGDSVSSATINQSGFIMCKATFVGEDTSFSKIIKMVSDASASKAPIAKIADKVSGIFVPCVVAIAMVTFILWLFFGEEISFALARGISVLVISCPCALGLATPVAIMVGSGVGAKNGILFKNAVTLENTGKTQIVVLDKTGTVTTGKMNVTDIIPAENVTEKELLAYAYSLEIKSEHPLAKAIQEYAAEKNTALFDTDEYETHPGCGVTGKIKGEVITGGSVAFIKSITQIPVSVKEKAKLLSSEGKTPLLFIKGSEYLGMTAVSDTIKPESPEAVRQLKNMGIKVVMLTGDNEKTAKAIAEKTGISEIIADVLPDGKEEIIKKLQLQGKTMMVGDGINDAPALTRADIGVAIGSGTDVAIDAADIVLIKNKLTDVPTSIKLSRATLKNIKENLFWAFIYNVIGIPVAAGCFIAAFGLKLSPMFGAAAMSLSSFFVVTNALRLNYFKTRK
ncbi:MAG: heavy metal translocating P-type ATPase [Clostridiales bacterium]|nr:heavy metal translocating P-type ATPase [Clostridiales bacterium]